MCAFIVFVVIVAVVSFVLGRELRDEETFAKEQWERMFEMMEQQKHVDDKCESCDKKDGMKD